MFTESKLTQLYMHIYRYRYRYTYTYLSEKAMAPHSSTLAWKIHGWRSLVGCSPWGRWESDMTERLHFHFSLSFIGEGNGNPLQYSCLENPRDGRAWWAAVYGVTQSRTLLKRLSRYISIYRDIYTFFFIFFSIMVYHIIVSCAIQ